MNHIFHRRHDDYKVERLYIEVRYAKATCLSMNTETLKTTFSS